MNRADYLAALTRALADLPDETTARVVADYAQRFDAAVATGLSEHEAACSMPDPGAVASSYWATARRSAQPSRFDVAAFTGSNQSNAAHSAGGTGPGVGQQIGQTLATGFGLAILNLFMLIPTLVYASLMTALFAVAMALYGSGIVVTAAAVVDADTFTFVTPFHNHLRINGEDTAVDTRASGNTEVTFSPGLVTVTDGDPADDSVITVGHTNLNFFGYTGEESRLERLALGIAAILSGIMLLLLGLVVLKYSVIAAKQYVKFNIAALKIS